MKNKKRIFKVIVSILILGVFILLSSLDISEKNDVDEAVFNGETVSNTELDYTENENNSVMYDNNATLSELKNEYKITGKDELYEIQTEKDGRKVLNVKASINYKVAFCGMIKNAKPSFEDIDSIFEQNNPTEKGIWIEQKAREKILNYLNNSEDLNSKYIINNEGYLEISQTGNETHFDKKINNLINGNNQYVFSISSKYYMVDPVTGEIIDNPYNDLEEYQTYEYVKDENKMIIFITENLSKVMSNDDIFGSIMNLLDFIE